MPSARSAKPLPTLALLPPALLMAAVVALSNWLVQHPVMVAWGPVSLADYLTWGAFTYPIAFLVTDTTNRLFGPGAARRVVAVGFALGVVMSAWLATPRIAAASGAAFLTAQLLDVHIFDRLRRGAWWRAPAVSSLAASALDTALFFSLAFAGTGLPWTGWAAGDFAAKLLMIAALLYPFKWLARLYPAAPRAA